MNIGLITFMAKVSPEYMEELVSIADAAGALNASDVKESRDAVLAYRAAQPQPQPEPEPKPRRGRPTNEERAKRTPKPEVSA